jgi:drug/metabolite transporter (DMT)-like permease
VTKVKVERTYERRRDVAISASDEHRIQSKNRVLNPKIIEFISEKSDIMSQIVQPLSVGQVIGLVTFAASMATGQVLFKLGAMKAPQVENASGWISLIFQPVVLTALCLYAASTFLWLWLLQRIPLTTAYPFAALAFLLVPFGGWLFFKEPLNGRYLLGVALILAGVVLTSASR